MVYNYIALWRKGWVRGASSDLLGGIQLKHDLEMNRDYLEYHERKTKTRSGEYIEDIQMFLLNMAFISPSEVENIYIS